MPVGRPGGGGVPRGGLKPSAGRTGGLFALARLPGAQDAVSDCFSSFDRMIGLLTRPRATARAASWRVRRVARKLAEATDMARSADVRTFHPEADRKGTLKILREQIYFLLRDNEVESFYYHVGRDRKGVRPNDFLTYAQFRSLRDGRNLRPVSGGYTYACIFRDKLVFDRLASALGHPTPRTVAVIEPAGVTWIGQRETEPLDAILGRDLDGFCKPIGGISGRGTMAVRIEAGAVSIDDEPAMLGDLRDRLDGRSLLQERVVQHEAFARLNPTSLNTLRIVTVLDEGAARVFNAHVRMGRGGRVTDNANGGGIVVDVDPASGRAKSDGLVWVGAERWVPAHPETGVVFADLVLPRVPEAVDLACRFHEDLPHVHTVGWDVAMTPDGPLVVEANDNWGGGMMSAFDPEYVRAFARLFEAEGV